MTATSSLASDVLPPIAQCLGRTEGPGPAWLSPLRSQASAWVSEHGFPTRKHEDWRYLPLKAILETPFRPGADEVDHQVMPRALGGLDSDLGGTRLVFVNGRLAPEWSRFGELPEGVRVTSLAAVVAEAAERLRPTWSRPYGHAFAALNAALASDGAFVQLPADSVVEDPIELVFWSDASDSPLLSIPRSVVLAGAGSRASVVETYAGADGGLYCTNAVTEITLANGARVEHHKVQDEARSAFHLASLQVHMGRASHFSSRSVALGGAIARHEVEVHLGAEEAEVDLEGLYMPAGAQHHDNPILVDHAAPRCTSRQLYKGIVEGGGHGVFNGHVVVRPGAFGTDAAQTNKNLLLSERAEVDTRPRLEILADDVMCTHGAAVGHLDEDALFYLRSRGIPREAARGLLTFGFAQEMVQRWPPGPLRSRVERLVGARLGASGAGSDRGGLLPSSCNAPAGEAR